MLNCIRASRLLAAIPLALLGGCASLSPDGGMATVAAISGQDLNKDVVKVRSGDDAARAQNAVTRLLRQSLSADEAVQIALLNNLGLQAAYNQLGVDEAVFVQMSRPPVPSFSISRVSTSLELDIERQIVGSILSIATLPARAKIAGMRFEQAQLRAALETLSLAAETRRAYFKAVAARQRVAALSEVQNQAENAAKLAGHLTQTGAVNRLEQAQRQVVAVEIDAQFGAARQQATTEREKLTRLMGLWHYDIGSVLPSVLPPLPNSLRSLRTVEQEAMDRRVDLQIARLEVEALAKSYGMTRTTRFVNVLDASGISKTQKDRGDGPHADGGGFEIAFEIPIYDFGRARVREAEQRYMQAVNLLGEKVVNAASEARQAYAAYKSTHGIAAKYDNEVLPLRETIARETELQYNAMQVDAFALIQAAKDNRLAKLASIEAHKDFWLASADLSVAILGGGSLGQEFTATIPVDAATEQ
jgi:outer membrane protein TolC